MLFCFLADRPKIKGNGWNIMSNVNIACYISRNIHYLPIIFIVTLINSYFPSIEKFFPNITSGKILKLLSTGKEDMTKESLANMLINRQIPNEYFDDSVETNFKYINSHSHISSINSYFKNK